MKITKSKSKSLVGCLHGFRTAGLTRPGGSSSVLLGTVAVALCILSAGQVMAVNRTWTGTIDSNWNEAGNWNTGVPLSDDDLFFNGLPANQPTINNLTANIRLGGFTFNNTTGDAARAVTLAGNTIRLNGNIGTSTITSGTTAVTDIINLNLDMVTASRTISTNAGPGTTASHNITINGIFGDAGGQYSLSKGGSGDSGILTLTNAANKYRGANFVNSGVLAFTSVANAGVNSALGNGSLDSTINVGSVGVAGTLRYVGTTVGGHSSNRVINLAGTTGGATIEANGTGPLVFTGTNTATGLGDKILTLSGSNTLDNSIGTLVDSVGFTTSLTKSGAGKWILSGTNTHTGATTVSNGTLLVNGSLGDTTVTVAGAATLGGSGTIGTSAVLNTLTVNGALVPGNSTGILTVNDNLDLNGNLSMELNGTTAGTGHDQVAVNGAVDITGSTLTAGFAGFTPVDGDILFIVVNDLTDAIIGTFTGLSQDAVVASFGGFLWKISYNADSTANTFTGTPNGNDIALMAVPDPNAPVIVSSWTFDSGATSNARLASSGTATGLTVSQLNIHPTFDVVMMPVLVANDSELNALSIHDRWAADTGGFIRMRRADYLQGDAPPGRSATYSSTNTSTSGAPGTLGAPIWFSVTTDLQTGATIHAISLTSPGGGSLGTYHFSKSGDPLGAGVGVVSQETISLAAPITLGANETVFFSINIYSSGVGTNNNINRIDLKGTTEALPPPIGLVTSTLTVGAPFGTYNRLSVTVDPVGLIPASSDTTDLSGTVNMTVNINPVTGKTSLLTLSNGSVTATNMNFSTFAYDIDSNGLSAEVKTKTPPGTVDPNTGVFAANQHAFIINQGTFSGTAGGQPFSEMLTPANPFSGTGTGNGTLTLTPAGTSGPYKLFNAVVLLPVAISEFFNEGDPDEVLITGTGTVKATGQIQMPSSEFNAWMIAQGATSFDPEADTAGNGAPDGIKWALGLSSLYDDPLPFLLKPVPSAPGTFTITLPPGGTVAPLTVESTPNLLPPWTPVSAGQMVPSVNPIPAGSTGEIEITPTPASKVFLRTRANP